MWMIRVKITKEICGKYKSKFSLERGILEARFEHIFAKSSVSLSAITLLLVEYVFFVLKF